MTSSGIYVHEKGVCESADVGAGTRVWAFAHVLPGAKLGANCNVCDNVFIENDVVVGDDVTIKCGVQLWDGLRIGHRVFIGPNVTFTNDKYPRSKIYPDKFAQTVVEDGASIGANATILPGIRIAQSAIVAAGAVVTRDVPANALVVGNPARVVGFVTNEGRKLPDQVASSSQLSGIGSCSVRTMPCFSDSRGSLVVSEYETGFPFMPRRSFLIYDVSEGQIRGDHAHKECEQFIVTMSGAVNCLLDNGVDRAVITLDDPSVGLYLPAKTWCTLFEFSAGSVVQVYASLPYDDADYVRDYKVFRQLVRR